MKKEKEWTNRKKNVKKRERVDYRPKLGYLLNEEKE